MNIIILLTVFAITDYTITTTKKTGDTDEQCILKTGKRQRDNATIEINMRTILQ
jgi:hypothetical protein